jgi:putative flippase GtrA
LNYATKRTGTYERRDSRSQRIIAALSSSGLERARRFYATRTGGRFVRFAFVSAFNLVFSVAVLAIVFGVFRLWTEVPSTLFANVVTIPPAYYLTRTWAWGKSGRSHLMKEVVPFWAMTLVGIAFSIVTAAEARHLGLAHHLGRVDRTALVVAANLFAFGVTWIGKFLLLNLVFREPVVARGDDVLAGT